MHLPRHSLISVVALALLLPAIPAPAAPALAGPTPMAGEQRLDHISITRMGATGSPVVLIPGLSSPRAVWTATATALAAKHRLFVVQINGFAGDAPGANLTAGMLPAPGLLPAVVEELHRTVTANHIAGAAVIGHSMGGLLGMMYAKAYPTDVGRLMIVDSLPFYGVLMVPPGTPATVAAVMPMATGMRDQLVASYGKPANDAVVTRMADALAVTPAAQAQVKAWMLAADARVSGEGAYEDVTTDLRGQLAGLTMPVMVIVPWHPGAYPKDATVAFYRAQYVGAPQIDFVPIDGAGHFVMLD